MQKNIFLLLTFLLVFVFSGCGSNSKVDGSSEGSTSTTQFVEMKNNTIVPHDNGRDFTLKLDFVKKLDSNYLITLDGYALSVNGCSMSKVTPSYSPSSLKLDGGMNSTEILYITGTFDTNCTILGYTFTATQTVTKDSNVDKSEYSSTFDYSDPDGGGDITPPSENGYSFYNATSPLVVKQFSTTYPIKVQLTNNGFTAPGKQVVLKAFADTLGSMNTYSVITGEDGYANFEYTSPEKLPTNGIVTDALEMIFTDENNITYTQFIDLKFDASSGNGGVTSYAFDSISTVTITHAEQVAEIKAQLIYNGVPIAGKSVTMLAITDNANSVKGSITEYTVTTGVDGNAIFTYIAPSTLNDVNGTTLTLTIQYDEINDNIEDNVHLEAEPTIYFDETTDTIQGDVTLPTVVIPSDLRSVSLDTNSKTIQIDISVYKDISPYTSGSVKVELPAKVLNGIDVGQFDAYEVPVNSQGKALFNYTGPSNLQALIDNNDTESIFKFYHLENIDNKQSMKVMYELPANPHVTRNYALDIVTSGDFSMGIPEKEKTFNVLLKVKDSSGNDVSLSDENITKITVETTNSPIAQILNTDTDPYTLENKLELEPVNNSPFILCSKTSSGLVPIEVAIEFTDVNGDPQSLKTIVNVRVFSGPASAISISYVSTDQDPKRAKYVETYAISVTDEYGNRVNTRPNISLGAIVGYAVDGKEDSSYETNETKRLFYGRSDIANDRADGEIIALGSNRANFEDNTLSRADVFKYVNAEGNNTDKLVVFGERKNYEAMGKWDITKTDNNTLELKDDYYGVDREGLYYAVGHNYYQDPCRDDGREWVGTTGSDTYQLDEEGTVIVQYKYDYHLAGKDALIWVNLDGIQPDTGAMTRVGEAVKQPLRGMGLMQIPSGGYILEEGAEGYGTFIIWHSNAPERYRNAHFGYAIDTTCDYELVASSNSFDARTCDNTVGIDDDDYSGTEDVLYGTFDGTSYVTYKMTAPEDKSCIFNLVDLTISSEF